MTTRILYLLVPSLLALAACSQTAKTAQTPVAPPPVLETMTDPATGSPVIAGPVLKGTAPRTPGKTSSVGAPAGQSADALNTTSSTERAEAAAPPATAERRLGSTVASLGDPSQPGFWVKTPLVQSETNGRIVNPANGKSAKVRLIPLGGAAGGGSQVSLPALQLIGVSLTDLPTIEVYSG
ncbi:hypothetical protein [Paracoccus lutimaris]|uniref:D-galactarate dehydratase n=1 Tax=Paracoccus lutimaris TaxID=1490030 RepID=A0A368Z078_9RHOB|nr:hypothetical protein [Paracoccus lutimaris]RCW85860.1 hypothetical protein DFP89_105127 [Paracoccus lutimaris]